MSMMISLTKRNDDDIDAGMSLVRERTDRSRNRPHNVQAKSTGTNHCFRTGTKKK